MTRSERHQLEGSRFLVCIGSLGSIKTDNSQCCTSEARDWRIAKLIAPFSNIQRTRDGRGILEQRARIYASPSMSPSAESAACPPPPPACFPKKVWGICSYHFGGFPRWSSLSPPPTLWTGGRHLIPLMVQAPSQAIGRGRGTGRGSGTNLWRPGRPRRKSTEPKPNCPGYQMQHCGKAPKSTVVKIGIRDIRTSPFLLTGQKRLVFVRNKESHP